MTAARSVDLLYLACNRVEFTQETFTALVANTDWEAVNELFVYDDGSQDGTREWLEQAVRTVPATTRFLLTRFGSPVAAMVHFIESATAPMLAKTDNDAMLPPGWLRQSLAVLERHPELALLGIEAMYPHSGEAHVVRSYAPAEFISGLGLYRREVFTRSRPRPYQKWFGLEEWQAAQGQGLVRGWITPALPVFLLDRVPFEPWTGYSERYVRCGWQRAWPKYDPACTLWHWHWQSSSVASQSTSPRLASSAENETGTFAVVILSKRTANLIPCVQSVLANEPTLPAQNIIVVDDGARNDAEAHLPAVRWMSGEKPFIYARNINIGIRAAGTDVILLNDDARLLTPSGFTCLSEEVKKQPAIGVCSAGIRGAVGNPRQIASGRQQLYLEDRTLAFVCVYIPKSVYDQLGPLDEQFNGYGFEDNDYCTRALRAGLKLGIWDGCTVDHSGELTSTFRTQPNVAALFDQNRRLFRQKWGSEV